MKNQVLLFYKYVDISDPASEREEQLYLCNELGLLGRTIIGTEGINATLSGTLEATNEYMKLMDAHPLFCAIDYKIDLVDKVPFKKLSVKVRDEIVTLGVKADPKKTATHLSPEEFNAMIEDPDVVLFDARNNYESAIGRFRNAITPDISLFKELPDALSNYEELKNKKVVTYCTGGIRCEKASALLKEKGFRDVYQLDGGIVTYAKAFPDGAFEGECFVFDERMKVGFKDSPELLGSCIECSTPTNDYLNCANKSCNKLVLVCDDCRVNMHTCSRDCTLKLSLSLVE
jgi:UPF0176 protein